MNLLAGMCTMPPPLENGVQDLIMNNNTPAYEMKMSCDKGFDMIGVETVICNDGSWNTLPSSTKCTSTHYRMYIDPCMHNTVTSFIMH